MKFIGVFKLDPSMSPIRHMDAPSGALRVMTDNVAVDEDGNVFHLCLDRFGKETTNVWVQVAPTEICRLPETSAETSEGEVFSGSTHIRPGYWYDRPTFGDWHYNPNFDPVPKNDWPAEAVKFEGGHWVLKHPSGKISWCRRDEDRLPLVCSMTVER